MRPGASLRAFAALLGRNFRAFDGSLNARAAWKSAVHVIMPLIAGITDSGGAGESENESDVHVGTFKPVSQFPCSDHAHQLLDYWADSLMISLGLDICLTLVLQRSKC
jgi:hypothetical protein